MKKTFSVCESALLNTLKLFSAKRKKMLADFLVLYSKNDIFLTRSVHCSSKNIELVTNNFALMLQKKKKTFYQNKF